MSPPQDLVMKDTNWGGILKAAWSWISGIRCTGDLFQFFFSSQEKQLLLSESTVNYYYYFNFMLNAVPVVIYSLRTIYFSIYQNWFAYMIINTTTHSFSDLIVSTNFMFGKHWFTIALPQPLPVIFQNSAKDRQLMTLKACIKFFKKHYPHTRCNIWVRDQRIGNL